MYSYQKKQIWVRFSTKEYDKVLNTYAQKQKVYAKEILFPEDTYRKMCLSGFHFYAPENDLKNKENYISQPLTDQEIQERIPETVDGFLISLRELINNSLVVDGRILCEQLFGIPKKRWFSDEGGFPSLYGRDTSHLRFESDAKKKTESDTKKKKPV